MTATLPPDLSATVRTRRSAPACTPVPDAINSTLGRKPFNEAYLRLDGWRRVSSAAQFDAVAEPTWTASLADVVRRRAASQQPAPSAIPGILTEIVGHWVEATDQHGVWWDAAAWRDGLAGTPLVGAVERVADGLTLLSDRTLITREHVFSVRDRPIDLFVASMAWGYGLSGYGWYRTRALFGRDGSAQIPRLVGELQESAGSPERTWTVLRGSQGLRGLGPAFGTKIAYFAGYDRTEGCGPLIADRWTAWSFWALAGSWDIRASADLYRRYVETATSWAAEVGVRSDDLERALFVAGPHVLRTWRALKSGR
ncbi:hypothetical protein [Dactylosporangium sp. NPDC006015]|uniref:8-oxoguanine DNA glycosylase OGG fold protein n=1 Tax=Dactylosporangium sp. NPDC006015 TaxID=3154576 RepID=UPI0033A2B7D1